MASGTSNSAPSSSRRRGRPATYPHIKRRLYAYIQKANLGTGDALGSEKSLCERFSTSRAVLRRALQELKNEGRVISRAGAGHFVNTGGQPAARRETGVISLVLGRLTSEAFRFDQSHLSGIVEGIESAFADSPYRLVMETLGHSAGTVSSIVRPHLSELCGVILVPFTDQSVERMAAQIPGDVYKVVVGRPADHMGLPSVVADYQHGIHSALRHLLTCGHQRIGFIQIGPPSWLTRQQHIAWTAAHDNAGLRVNPALHAHCRDSEQIDAAVGQLLKLAPAPTALLIGAGSVLMQVIGALARRNVRIPDDLSLISYDDIPFSKEYVPAVSVIREPNRQLGRLGAGMLRQLLNGQAPEPGGVVLKPELVARDSVAAPRASGMNVGE